MIDTIKVNGGSFKLSAVLSYSNEGDFVEYYNRVLPTWLVESKRKATLREVYKLAHDIKKKQDDNAANNDRKVTRSGYRPVGKDDDRTKKGLDH